MNKIRDAILPFCRTIKENNHVMPHDGQLINVVRILCSHKKIHQLTIVYGEMILKYNKYNAGIYIFSDEINQNTQIFPNDICVEHIILYDSIMPPKCKLITPTCYDLFDYICDNVDYETIDITMINEYGVNVNRAKAVLGHASGYSTKHEYNYIVNDMTQINISSGGITIVQCEKRKITENELIEYFANPTKRTKILFASDNAQHYINLASQYWFDELYIGGTYDGCIDPLIMANCSLILYAGLAYSFSLEAFQNNNTLIKFHHLLNVGDNIKAIIRRNKDNYRLRRTKLAL